ncbi:condensation domain-containing protein, partial [Pantanalinema sp. GBBB05]|uniref:condensation domain-containing protein n=1 Tax=Pantanalinema sp. GBBB05 TaxID=2604139 RepID=UPI001D373ABB|nr:hypothetical protein [Pantanalinema sp. GBBB05]
AGTYRGASVRRVLPVAVSAGLNALSAAMGVSLFVTLLAGFNALLHQYSGQVDLVVCTPVVGRQRRETRGLLGYFNHVVALRNDLSGNPGFRELVERVGHRFVEASSYQEVPLQWVAELPSVVRVPLSRAMFVLQNTAVPVLQLDGLTVSSEFVAGEIANFDLSLSVAEHEGQLTAVLQYKTDLFNSDTIAQMLEQYIALLEHLMINPDQHLLDLPALTQNQTVSHSLTNAAEVNTSLDSQYIAPRNALEQDLTRIWQNTFKIQSIGITDNFFTLGGHSLLAVEMLTRIEQQCGTKLPITTLLQAPTIAALAEVIQTSGEELMNDLVPLKLGGSKPPLFCLYGVLLYQDLAHQLDPDQPVYGVFLKEEVELLKAGQTDQFKSIFSSVPAIASRYLETIRQQQPHGPYYLCGESFGGLVAYEIAQQLTAIDEEVALVALFDSLPPTEYSHAQLKLRDRLGMHLKLLRQQGFAYLYEKAEPYKQKVQQKLIAAGMSLYQPLYPMLTKIAGKTRLQHKLTQAHQVLSDSTNGKQQEDIREQVRRQMTQGYVLQPYSGTLLLFRAMERDAFEMLGYDLGWGEVASDDFHIYDIPGDHIGILKSPNVQGLAEKLQQHITASHPQTEPEPLKPEIEQV